MCWLNDNADGSSGQISVLLVAGTVADSVKLMAQLTHLHASIIVNCARMELTIPDELLPAAAKGAIFDLDGTLLDTMPHHWAAWEQTAREHGIALTCNQLLALAGKPSTAIMELLCQQQGLHHVDQHAAVQRKQDLYVALAGDTQPVEVVLRIAHAAKARGLPLAVATGGSKRQVQKAMAAAGLSDFFHAVVTCDDVENGKPHPETFLRAAELIGVEPQHCVGYEDAPLGMEAIRRAGFLAAVDVTLLEGYPKLI